MGRDTMLKTKMVLQRKQTKKDITAEPIMKIEKFALPLLFG
jgi:hypothetical protein